MKTKIILVVLLALLVGGIGGYFLKASDRYAHMMGWQRSAPQAETVENSDTTDMHGMHGMNTSITEKEFIEGMIPHHQEAVDTAKQVVARGASPEVKELAEAIITAQEKEIIDMKTWYRSWYGKEYADTGTYQPMMQDLSSLSGEALDRVFLQDMIMHHMGALMMAQHVAANIEHTEIQTLAQNIAETQSAEIVTMRMLLKSF